MSAIEVRTGNSENECSATSLSDQQPIVINRVRFDVEQKDSQSNNNSVLKQIVVGNNSSSVVLEHPIREKSYTPNPKARDGNSHIRVAVRKRPLNPNEPQQDVIAIHSYNYMTLYEVKRRLDTSVYLEKNPFMFDDVFSEEDNNAEVYRRVAAPLIDVVCNGGYSTCFAYGQTGSGKTYTMMGTEQEPGFYLLAAQDLFARLDNNRQKLCVSFFEIYLGKLFDLLAEGKEVFCREDGFQKVHIRGLSEYFVTNVHELMKVVDRGTAIRKMGETGANAQSSRSHAILHVMFRDIQSQDLCGKFTFIDLAGSERGADTKDSDKQTRKEGAEINKSLLALKECIRALDMNKPHIPFRGSKLTEVLKDSFVGNSQTLMIAAVSPSIVSGEHTLNTLRYADRVKDLKPPQHKEDDESASNCRAMQPFDASRAKEREKCISAENLCEEREGRSHEPGSDSEGRKVRSHSAPAAGHGSEKVRCPCCKEDIEKAVFEEHRLTCNNDYVKCEHCGTSTRRKQMEAHMKVCLRLPVCCQACGVVIPKCNMARHVNNDCLQGITSCIFCKKKLLRAELEAHRSSECMDVRMTCEHCGASVKRCKLSHHLLTCNKMLVLCPNGCGCSIAREKLSKHELYDCKALVSQSILQTPSIHLQPGSSQSTVSPLPSDSPFPDLTATPAPSGNLTTTTTNNNMITTTAAVAASISRSTSHSKPLGASVSNATALRREPSRGIGSGGGGYSSGGSFTQGHRGSGVAVDESSTALSRSSLLLNSSSPDTQVLKPQSADELTSALSKLQHDHCALQQEHLRTTSELRKQILSLTNSMLMLENTVQVLGNSCQFLQKKIVDLTAASSSAPANSVDGTPADFSTNSVDITHLTPQPQPPLHPQPPSQARGKPVANSNSNSTGTSPPASDRLVPPGHNHILASLRRSLSPGRVADAPAPATATTTTTTTLNIPPSPRRALMPLSHSIDRELSALESSGHQYVGQGTPTTNSASPATATHSAALTARTSLHPSSSSTSGTPQLAPLASRPASTSPHPPTSSLPPSIAGAGGLMQPTPCAPILKKSKRPTPAAVAASTSSLSTF